MVFEVISEWRPIGWVLVVRHVVHVTEHGVDCANVVVSAKVEDWAFGYLVRNRLARSKAKRESNVTHCEV